MPFAKGPSQKNRDVSWRVSAASLVNGAPFYYTREHHPSTILISPSLSPRAAYGSPLFLSLSPAGQTSPSIIDLVENIYYEKTSARQAKMLETFFIRFESFQVPFADEGVLRDIVRNLDTDDVSTHMTTHYFLIIFPRVLFLFPLFHCILSQNVSINEIHLLSNNW